MTNQPNQNEKCEPLKPCYHTNDIKCKNCGEIKPDAVQADEVKPCDICTLPLSGAFIGNGDGTGQRFAHPECWYRKEMELAHKRIAEQQAKIDELIQAIATERDAFGKKETELMAKIDELQELNRRAKDVLEKTLDWEASACVARNRLEKQLEESRLQIQAQKTVIEKSVKALKITRGVIEDGGHANDYEGITARCPNCNLCEIEEALQSAAALEKK